MGKKKGRRAAADSDDDEVVDPIASALAKGEEEGVSPVAKGGKGKKKGKNQPVVDDDDEDELPPSVPKKKALTKAELRKLQREEDNEVEPPAAPELAENLGKKLSKAEQRKLKKKGKATIQQQEDSEDDDIDPIAAALAKQELGGEEDDEEEETPAQPVVKKLSKAEQRKLKKKGKAAIQQQEDSDDDDIDPITAALANQEQEEDEDETPAQPVVKKLSKAEQRKQKKKGKKNVEEQEDDDDIDPIATASANQEQGEDTLHDATVIEDTEVKEEISSEQNVCKKEEKKTNIGGTEESKLPLVEEEAENQVENKKTSIFGGKKKGGETSAFALAMAKRDENKREDEDDDDADPAERLAKYEKKLAKALKKGDEADVSRYRAKVEKYQAKIDAENKESKAKAARQAQVVNAEKAAAAAGGLLSGKDGEAWRDDSNDINKSLPDTFEEYLGQVDGKALSGKARKKLEKEYNAKKRQVEECKDREQRSLEGAQFACSQSAVDENDPNWQNALDIKIDSFSISAAGKTLFENSPLMIGHGRRYGIVGPNGRGKTTLLKMIASGALKTPPRVNCLYVEQEVAADDVKAVDAVLRADKERTALMQEENELAKALENDQLSPEEQREKSERIAAVGEELKAIGAAAAESKARRILFGLGFSAEMQMRPTKLFSGGWRMRISLARALFIEPTLLMLDEPTNHLDLNAVIWLDDYLQGYKHTLLIVSHDQDFLNSVCIEILHISDDKKLDAYKGNYDTFKTLEKQKRLAQLKAYEKQEKQLRALKSKATSKAKAEELVKKQAQQRREPGARSKKQAIASGQDSAEVTQLIQRPHEYIVVMRFPQVAKLAPPVLQVCDASFRYSPELPYIFTDMNFGMDQDTRVCVVGSNGAGKSTLLHLLTGKLNPTEGEIKRNPRLRIGVYNQHFVERLPMDENAVDYLRRLFDDETYQSIRNMLGKYGLEGHAHTINMRDLSGGQKARVVLVELSLAAPHMLLLDEPTNNLDIETIDALCDAINEYDGGVICVTHDARLIEATNMRLWVVENRQVTEWAEPFTAYRDHLLKTLEEAMNDEDQRLTAAGLSVDMGGHRN